MLLQVNRWRPAGSRLPYSTVAEFRAYVLARKADLERLDADADDDDDGEEGTVPCWRHDASEPAAREGVVDEAVTSKGEGATGFGAGGVGFSDSSVRLGVGDLGDGQSGAEAGEEKELVLLGPWGSLESLMMSREEAMALMMQRRGFDVRLPVALNATELYEEDLKWAELDEVAESEWKFFRSQGPLTACLLHPRLPHSPPLSPTPAALCALIAFLLMLEDRHKHVQRWHQPSAQDVPAARHPLALQELTTCKCMDLSWQPGATCSLSGNARRENIQPHAS